MADRVTLKDAHGVKLTMTEIRKGGSTIDIIFHVETTSPYERLPFKTRDAAEEVWFQRMSDTSSASAGSFLDAATHVEESDPEVSD